MINQTGFTTCIRKESNFYPVFEILDFLNEKLPKRSVKEQEKGENMSVWIKTTTGKITALLVAAVAVVAVGAAVLLMGEKEESYRTISVEETNGTSVVVSADKSVDAYEGMHLYSGDDVTVKESADMTMLLDMDKYVYAEENTHFSLEATGDETSNNTVIHLDEGAVLNRLADKLESGSVYQVDTPNSTMSVRGTVFWVCVTMDEEGIITTKLDVFDGSVELKLKNEKGELNGDNYTIKSGEAVQIRNYNLILNNDDNPDLNTIKKEDNTIENEDYLTINKDNTIKNEDNLIIKEDDFIRKINYEELSKKTILKLISYIEDGEILCNTIEEIKDFTGLEEHKWETVVTTEATCAREGEEQKVCSICGEVAKVTKTPKLSHTAGEWTTLTEATCTTPGVREQLCTVCGERIGKEETPATGHTMGAWTTLSEATCTAAGAQTRSCTICGGATETRNVAALGHSMSGWGITQPATCTANGIQMQSCTRCGASEVSSIAATGHNMSGWTVTKTATCTEAGSQTRTCTTCGMTEASAIAATGHTPGRWAETVPATCVTAGTRTTNCTVCGATITESIAANPSAHSLPETAQHLSHNATLNADGRTATITAICECENEGCNGVETTITTSAEVKNREVGTFALCTCGEEVPIG